LFHAQSEFRLQQMPGVLGRFLDEVAGGFVHVILFFCVTGREDFPKPP
jgi:hypothetical protein